MDAKALLSPFVGPLGEAAFRFPAVALLLALPLGTWHYRRHGKLHPWRAFLAYSFVFYAIAAVFLVLLPLPDLGPRGADTGAWEELYGRLRHPQLNPLGFVLDIARAPTGIKVLRAAFQALFNLLLLLPLGFYLVYGLRRKPLAAGLWGLGSSLLLEVCQLTGDFWIYPGPYRLFDTGDLLLNSAGAFLGALLASRLVSRRRLPDLDSLRGPQGPWIGPVRKALGLLGDLLAYGSLVVVLASFSDLTGLRIDRGHSVLAASVAILVFILLPALDKGRGPGRRLTLCAIHSRRRPGPNPGAILLRQSLLWLYPALLYPATILLPRGRTLSLAYSGGLVLWLGLLALNAILAALNPEGRGLVDRIAGTEVRNTWKDPRDPPTPKPT